MSRAITAVELQFPGMIWHILEKTTQQYEYLQHSCGALDSTAEHSIYSKSLFVETIYFTRTTRRVPCS